jgi:hypothetical protein
MLVRNHAPRHAVVLISPNGREQSFVLRVIAEGLVLSDFNDKARMMLPRYQHNNPHRAPPAYDLVHNRHPLDSRPPIRSRTTNIAQESNRFPWSVINKWLPANVRSKNPGMSDCLDLQLMTDKGAKELRMRMQGGPEEVQATIREIDGVVQASQ